VPTVTPAMALEVECISVSQLHSGRNASKTAGSTKGFGDDPAGCEVHKSSRNRELIENGRSPGSAGEALKV